MSELKCLITVGFAASTSGVSIRIYSTYRDLYLLQAVVEKVNDRCQWINRSSIACEVSIADRYKYTNEHTGIVSIVMMVLNQLLRNNAPHSLTDTSKACR